MIVVVISGVEPGLKIKDMDCASKMTMASFMCMNATRISCTEDVRFTGRMDKFKTRYLVRIREMRSMSRTLLKWLTIAKMVG